MREEIRKLFPLEFYINDKEEMVAEISINTLNKLSDEIIKLEDKIEKDKETQRLNNIINGDFATICKEKMIDKLSATEMIVVQDKEIKRLNNIIDKAIEYGKELRLFDNESVEFEIGTNFINILQGSDKE